MSRRNATRLGIYGVLLIGFVLGYTVACNRNQPSTSANAGQDDSAAPNEDHGEEDDSSTDGISVANTKPSPVKPTSDRDVYYPGTEELKPDEMRVICLGSGMPTNRCQ